MFYKLLGSCLILMLTCGVVQAQSMFDRCVTAMDAKDTKEIEKWATMIKRSAFSEDNADKAARCLEAAFGKGTMQEVLAKREAVSQKNNAAAKLACHRNKLSLINELIEQQEQVFKDQNMSLMANLTYEACIDLNKSKPYEAILNPICREVFKANFHPDYDLTKGLDVINKLKAAQAYNLAGLMDNQKIVDVAEGKQGSDRYASLLVKLDQALKPCD